MTTWYNNYFNKKYYSEEGEILCEKNHPIELEEYTYIMNNNDEHMRKDKMGTFITHFINNVYKTETFYDNYWSGKIFDKFGLVYFSRTKGGRELSKQYLIKKEDLNIKFQEFMKKREKKPVAKKKRRRVRKKEFSNNNIHPNTMVNKRSHMVNKRPRIVNYKRPPIVNNKRPPIVNNKRPPIVNKRYIQYNNNSVKTNVDTKGLINKIDTYYISDKERFSINKQNKNTQYMSDKERFSINHHNKNTQYMSDKERFSINKQNKNTQYISDKERFSINKQNHLIQQVTREKLTDIIPYSDKDYQFLRKKKKKMKKQWRKLQSQMMKLDEGLKKKKDILQTMEDKIQSYDK